MMVQLMFSLAARNLDRRLERRGTRAAWIAWARVAAVPFAVLEVAVERGNYPTGDERLAWAITIVFAAGAVAALAGVESTLASRRRATPRCRRRLGLRRPLLVRSRDARAAAPRPSRPQSALLYGVRGGILLALASLPALAFFEWRQAERLDLHPFDPATSSGRPASGSSWGSWSERSWSGSRMGRAAAQPAGIGRDDRGRSRSAAPGGLEAPPIGPAPTLVQARVRAVEECKERPDQHEQGDQGEFHTFSFGVLVD